MNFLLMSGMKYALVESIILFEFIAIALVILATLASKWFGYWQAQRKKNIKLAIQHYIDFLMTSQYHLQPTKFISAWQRLDILLALVDLYDTQFNDFRWRQVRVQLIHFIILPLARKNALKKNWIAQFYAAQVFRIFAHETDRQLITKLISSDFPVVRLAALQAALQFGSEMAFEKIINEIKDYPQLTQAVYIQAFTHAPIKTRAYIEKYLRETNDINAKIICYRILLSYAPGKIDWNINMDMNAGNEDLKLAALHLFAHTQHDLAVPILIDKLKDSDWQTKVVALNALGYLQADDYIPKITECLHDENAWVRLNAAQALKNLGEKGEQALAEKNITIDPKAFEVVRHVMRTL